MMFMKRQGVSLCERIIAFRFDSIDRSRGLGFHVCVCVRVCVCVCGFNRLANDSMLSAHHLAVGRFGWVFISFLKLLFIDSGAH